MGAIYWGLLILTAPNHPKTQPKLSLRGEDLTVRLTNFIHVAILAIGLGGTVLCAASQAADPAHVGGLEAALDELDKWVGDGPNGDRWRKYLRTQELRAQIKQGSDADPAVASRVLQQYQSGAKGLDKSRFVSVRRALETWRNALQQQHGGNLSKRVWAARGDHVPVSDKRLAPVRDELRSAAYALEQAIGGHSSFAENWKKYLLWDLLEPHFDSGVKITRDSLSDLDKTLQRYRKNQPGLENPEFTRTARAIERYREVALWYGRAERGDTRPLYATYLKALEKQLTRATEFPTVESTRQVGKFLGLIEDLGHSPQLVQQIRDEFSRPNVSLQISENAINRLGARPVSHTQPVRDCILGASVRGTATSRGNFTFHTVPAQEHIELEVRLVGHIESNTTSTKKSVKISSLGHTNFVATQRMAISDDRFVIRPPTARAQTQTQIGSIRKMGGRFGRRLVERIARKKVAESKAKAQRIASRKAEQKVSSKFNKDLAEALTTARRKYDSKWRPPLVRVGMFPKYLRMASHPGGVSIDATLASNKQISTAVPPPQLPLRDDVMVQVHETAANNFFPIVLAGVTLRQDQADQPPRLEGNVPDWLKKFSLKEEKEPAAAPAGSNSVGPAPTGSDLNNPAGRPVKDNEKFLPWAFQLNADHPVSLSFDDQKFTVRIRIAELKTLEDGEEKVRKNWDFLITYRILQDDGGLLIRREGDIEVLPTGFDRRWYGDPRWDDKLTGKQVSVRRNLEKNLNKRAAAGEGFPEEIKIPAIKLPGREQTLTLQQFDCDNGWLTLVYRLP